MRKSDIMYLRESVPERRGIQEACATGASVKQIPGMEDERMTLLKPRRDMASNIIQVIKDTKRGAWVTPEIAEEMLRHQDYLCEDCEKTVKIAKQNGLPIWVRWHDTDFHVHYKPEQEEWDSWSEAVQEKSWSLRQAWRMIE